jgi:hypothetical protein
LQLEPDDEFLVLLVEALFNRMQKKMSANDERPAVAAAHIVPETDCMEESAALMLSHVSLEPRISVLELRGGMHLILMRKDKTTAGRGPFDLVDDEVRATYERFTSLGLSPSAIEARPTKDHEVLTVREPASHVVTFFSSHLSGKPV